MSGAPGVSFRETMAGWFALGAADPAEGARLGRAAGTRLAMHARIDIADVAAFARAADHAGAISGTVDFAPLGRGLAAPRGEFRLFARDDAAGRKLMCYGLAFAHAGTEYWLSGRKHVTGQGVLAIWPETTTLYTRLHRGGPGGPVVGAGVLRLGPGGLLAMLSTMRGRGAGALAAPRALAGFGGFFAAELWDSYVRPRGAARA